MIDVRDVNVLFGHKEVLKGINLNINKGGITAIIGPNGAGKSTLISAMARITPIHSGEIEFDRQSVFTTPSTEMARKLAFMEQSNVVSARLSVQELLEFGRFPHHQGRPTNLDLLEVDKTIELFDLGAIADRLIDTLSGGERQRARAAMCYCQGTDYLLLDEPLNNLDIYYARQFMEVLRKVVDENGRTIVVVMHDINQAANYANDIIAVKDGQVVAHGSVAEVMNSQILKKVFGLDIPVKKIDEKYVCLHF